ncbi:hypothetical protein LOC67_16865 [Stieleria sp. JC731]|uniref:hypothetical protein n=1 Tax=Stieleria sp. JC731 TaxID=2894195 RepID=UPI001E295E12|nr:hypothetical protein [Stieleria sp. JC731]MCC9602229.1 hypothetical protein [Stieleria sp. JC731]
MTPSNCCEIGASYAVTGERDLAALDAAARLHDHSPFDVNELERELRYRPELVDGWLRWVEDKRWSPTWYFSPTDNGQYLVGYFSPDEDQKRLTVFDDRYRACAAFIIHELESYRLLLESKGRW